MNFREQITRLRDLNINLDHDDIFAAADTIENLVNALEEIASGPDFDYSIEAGIARKALQKD
jgi:hypothetical protein